MEQPLNPASLPPDTHVGPWRLGPLLGRGTFDTVYSPALSLLISRMLSVRPEERGTARELAEDLENAERQEGPAADVPLLLQEAPPAETRQEGVPPAPDAQVPRRSRWPRLTAAGVSAALAGAAALWGVHMHRQEVPATNGTQAGEELDGGTVGLGDSVLTAPAAPPRAPSGLLPIALDMPSKPLKGQERPDADGRCPDRNHVAINGGCWWKFEADAKGCSERQYVYRGKCYAPAFLPDRPATSSPADAPDAGAR